MRILLSKIRPLAPKTKMIITLSTWFNFLQIVLSDPSNLTFTAYTFFKNIRTKKIIEFNMSLKSTKPEAL